MRRELMPVSPLTTVLCLVPAAHAAGFSCVQTALTPPGEQSTQAAMTRSSR
jgi:hypothetical protein